MQPATSVSENAFGSTAPATAFARIAHVSDVLVSLSTDSMLKETRTAARSIPSRSLKANAASVKMYASIVAMFGSIIPEPLAIQVIVAPSTAADSALGCVSVVMMPSAPRSGSAWSSAAMP